MARFFEEKELPRVSYWKTFPHDHLVIDQIKIGEWRALFPHGPTVPGADMLLLIVDLCNLDKDVKDFVCLRFTTYSGKGQERA